MLMLRAAFNRVEPVTRVGEVMLYRTKQVATEPALFPLRARDQAPCEQACKKILCEIARVTEIMRRSGDVSVNRLVVSSAQIGQRCGEPRLEQLKLSDLPLSLVLRCKSRERKFENGEAPAMPPVRARPKRRHSSV